MAYVIFNLLCVAVLIGVDQGIKFWAVHVLMPVGTLPLIPVATSAALILVAYWLFFRSRSNRLQQAALILVLGGGIGNLIDRVLNGEVVDYINLLFMRFAVFNFADICVCVGVALWVLVIFLEELHSGDAKEP